MNKQLAETPLHFACKYGSLEVARLFLEYDACLRSIKNKNGKTALDLVCTKAVSAQAKSNDEAIKNLFEGKNKLSRIDLLAINNK
jgi:ankyrin repeat protein